LADLLGLADRWALVKNQDGHLGSSSEEEKAFLGERASSMGTQLFSMAISSRDPPWRKRRLREY
jgi:hypothetical protein